jgi:hypothetical protein
MFFDMMMRDKLFDSKTKYFDPFMKKFNNILFKPRDEIQFSKIK